MDWRAFIRAAADTGEVSAEEIRELLGELLSVVRFKRADSLRLNPAESRDHAYDLASFLLSEGSQGGKSPMMQCWASILRNEREQQRQLSSDDARSKLMQVAINALPDMLGAQGRLPAGYEVRERLVRVIRKMELPREMQEKRLLAFGFSEPTRLGDLDVGHIVGLLGSREPSGQSLGVSDLMLPTEGELKAMLEELREIDGAAWYLLTDALSLALRLFRIPMEGEAGGESGGEPKGGEPGTESTLEYDLETIRKDIVAAIEALDEGRPFPEGQHGQAFTRVLIPTLFSPGKDWSAVLASEWGVSSGTVRNRQKAVVEAINLLRNGEEGFPLEDFREIAEKISEDLRR